MTDDKTVYQAVTDWGVEHRNPITDEAAIILLEQRQARLVDALRALVAGVEWCGEAAGAYECLWCEAWDIGPDLIVHRADCPIARGRALLAEVAP